MDYEEFTVPSECSILHIISDTKSQMHLPGFETNFRCKKMSNKHLSDGNAQKFGGVN